MIIIWIHYFCHTRKEGADVNKKRQIALNKLFNLCVVFGLFFIRLSIEFFRDDETAWAIGTGIAAVHFIIIPAIFTPFCYSFDSEGVSLCYVFLPTERYLWKDIYAIEVTNISTGKVSMFDFFYASVFSIKGKNAGKRMFYMEGNIRKSFRTKKLLERYWDGTITGYFFGDVQKRINKRRAKSKAQIDQHVTDEIVPMEREIRAEKRAGLKPFIEEAKQHELDIKVKYLYITSDLEELRSRPKEGYTYTLVAEIAHFNETDESRILVVSADLLYVRLGKKAYRGVYNDGAKEELHRILSDVLCEIGRNGIETYCDNN